MQHQRKPGPVGLYRPEFEHDACGVGMICNLRGEKSHYIVEKALEILGNLTHRGAAGSDSLTGDGAGILLQMPDKFLRGKMANRDVELPPVGEYACGLVFLPREDAQRQQVCDLFEQTIVEEGQLFIRWRDLPVNSPVIGKTARAVEPAIRQIFIGKGPDVADEAAFNRKLFVIRKVMERRVRESGISEAEYFYVPSLSSMTICYKGMFLADQVKSFFQDLQDPRMESGLALVHQRYSTNTFPTWDLAQPFRFMCHNGEINTVRGNANWMNARQFMFGTELFGNDIEKIFPIATAGASDTAILDNAVELLYHSGRSLPHAMLMLIPEAWQNHETMPDELRAFYEYHSSMMEPWDGPASIPFTDGTVIGAVLDRNGLRPSRYTVTKDGFVIMGSETGVLQVDPANVESKGRLEPGKMFLVDTEKGEIVSDEAIKAEMSARKPYREWINANQRTLASLPEAPGAVLGTDFASIRERQQLFGYTIEDRKVVLTPMAMDGKEAIGSMGVDTPMAVLSTKPQLLPSYFKQLFAQVTNPPLDAIRERLVTSLITGVGAESDLFKETPEHCRQLRLDQPILTNSDLARIRELDEEGFKSITLSAVFPAAGDGAALEQALDELCQAASDSIDTGVTFVILSDRTACRTQSPIPALLATAAVHHRLIRDGKRTRCGIVVETGEAREVQHFATLAGYGASAVNPYLAIETLDQMILEDMLPGLELEGAVENYIQAVGTGLLKVMSKIGISTLHSYRGAQIFEAVGINADVTSRYFTGTPSRVEGIGMDGIAREVAMRHERAYPPVDVAASLELDVGGLYQWRRNGEFHLFNPLTVAKLQLACRAENRSLYDEYAALVNDRGRELCTLRGMFRFKYEDATPISIDEVEPWTEIAKRFKTGAMSYGSIGAEAHETLAIAMNRIGGRSNSGEGGEDPRRFTPDENGDSRCSAIKQVASGRFGVSSHYLVNAKEIQIKMAQGAKPGEGGQLPGKKVWPWIAKVRNSTPYVGLISPPPHHDIYSIEDMAQLIHDLKNANDEARINVKLVAEMGVGTVAAGVSKGKADVVLISGWDGGTGASPETSLKHCGLPWELGLAETHQTLVLNDLRDRIVVEVDGQMKTGRDVAIAALLGGEEFGFATAPLVVSGCVMMRVCHLDTCPVGIATQNPKLREKYSGKPEFIVNYFRFVCEELREIMAKLGCRTIDELVGRVDLLDVRDGVDHWKANGLDFSNVLMKPDAPGVGIRCTKKQDHGLEHAIDHELIMQAAPAIQRGEKVKFFQEIRNVNRTVGTMLSSRISRKYGAKGLPDGTIHIRCQGSAGQSFGAFAARGITFDVKGDGNDYFGKGLSGARLIIRPEDESTLVPEDNVIIGNVALYGSTGGELFARGRAGERFCVRNSGATAVVEGVGDHCCEYMTGGVALILGATGRNFAAGMSGGVAFVLDEAGDFWENRCNHEMVELDPITEEDEAQLRELLARHREYTGSTVAERLLNNWDDALRALKKVMPTDYKRALERIAAEKAEAAVQGA